MTINKGMSGGPIVLVGKIPNDDRVIGIANFTVTPLGPPLAQLVQTVQNFPGRGIIMGMDFKQFTLLIKDTF